MVRPTIELHAPRLSLRQVQALWILWIGQAVCAGFLVGIIVSVVAGPGLRPLLGAGAVGLVMLLRILEDRVA